MEQSIENIVFDLQVGDYFVFAGKRKMYYLKNILNLDEDNIPLIHRGKKLLIVDSCKQIVCDPQDKVKIIDNSKFH